jgi:hypothetical protein
MRITPMPDARIAVISLSAESRPSVSNTPVSMPIGRAKEIAKGKISTTSRTNVSDVICPASSGPSKSFTTLGSATTKENNPTVATQVNRTLLKM